MLNPLFQSRDKQSRRLQQSPSVPQSPTAPPTRFTLPFVPVTWMMFSRSRSSTCKSSTTL